MMVLRRVILASCSSGVENLLCLVEGLRAGAVVLPIQPLGASQNGIEARLCAFGGASDRRRGRLVAELGCDGLRRGRHDVLGRDGTMSRGFEPADRPAARSRMRRRAAGKENSENQSPGKDVSSHGRLQLRRTERLGAWVSVRDVFAAVKMV
jgi:hypothetical protein